MKKRRSTPRLKTDLVIIGAGIHGAILAYEAAKFGYHVCLFEKGDFGGATSANSLKIIHGGIRYLQHMNFKRMRESIRSRRSIMQFAPHLVHPLPCLMPTYGHGLKGRETMRVAFALYDVIAFDRNHGLPEQNHLPAGGSLTRAQCLEQLPGLANTDLNGAALWYDSIAFNTERLLQEYLNESARYGAELYNYTEIVRLIEDGGHVTGVEVRDVMSGARSEVPSRMVVNTSGPWVDAVTTSLAKLSPVSSGFWAKAVNIIVKKNLFETFAVGLEGWREFADEDALIKRGKRLFFFVPWRSDYTMIGTSYKPVESLKNPIVDTDDVVEMISDINKIYPHARLEWDDITFVHGGLLPRLPDAVQQSGPDTVQLEKTTRIVDHEQTDKLAGILSISGVKYTTAPDIAWKTIKLLTKKIGTPPHPGAYVRSSRTGPPRDHTDMIRVLGDQYHRIVKHLKHSYGSHWRNVFDYVTIGEDEHFEELWLSHTPALMKAEVGYFINAEKAVKLADVVLRRSPLGSAECPPQAVLAKIAEFMAAYLDWSPDDCHQEIKEVQDAYFPIISHC